MMPDSSPAPPTEETERKLREAVAGAGAEARKSGMRSKPGRVPTNFWAFPAARPEKARTVRHAVRLPDDHPALREVSARARWKATAGVQA